MRREIFKQGDILAGAYQIEELLAAGGFGTVYRATHLQLGHPVAIKLLSRPDEEGSTLTERFRKEALLGARLRSAHLVDVLDAGETEEGTPFLVMELVRGPDLATFLQSGPLCAAAVIDLGAQVCAGLAVLDAHDIVHRDIKPQNIMLERDAAGLVMVKLVDFGIFKRATAASATATDPAVMGTPRYMAPEQLRGDTVDPRADLFALGAVLFESLVGRPPNEATTLMSHVAQAISPERPPVTELAPDTPPELADLVEQLLDPDPNARPSGGALEVRDALLAAARSAKLPTGLDAWEAHVDVFEQVGDPVPEASLLTVTDPFSTAVPKQRRWLGPLVLLVLVVIAGINVASLLVDEDEAVTPEKDPVTLVADGE